MNRRGFLAICAGSVASVTIGLRLSQGMPVAVKNEHMKAETVGDFTYYMDMKNPVDVSIYKSDDVYGDDPISVDSMNVGAKIEHATVNKYPLRAEDFEATVTNRDGERNVMWHKTDTNYERITGIETPALELCAIIAMSQGMAAYYEHDTPKPMMFASGEMDYADIPLAQIRT